MMQPAQPKPEAFRPQVYLWWTVPARVKANSNLMQSASAPVLYLSLPPTRQELTRGQWPEARIIVVIRGGESQARAEAQALLD